MGNIRISDEANDLLKELKAVYDLESIDKVIKLAIKNTPLPHSYETEPPALILHDEIDPDLAITWSDLKNSEIGDEWGNKIELVTVIFKDQYGVLLRIIEFNKFKKPIDQYINYFRFIK